MMFRYPPLPNFPVKQVTHCLFQQVAAVQAARGPRPGEGGRDGQAGRVHHQAAGRLRHPAHQQHRDVLQT